MEISAIRSSYRRWAPVYDLVFVAACMLAFPYTLEE